MSIKNDMHILLTRPLEDCSEMIMKFKSLGHQVSHLPLLTVDKVNHDKIIFTNYKGIIFTSANAIKFLDIKTIDKNLFVFVLEMLQKKRLEALVFKMLFLPKVMWKI